MTEIGRTELKLGVIDLDGPDEPAEAASPLSQADLDALLENLDDDLFSGKPRG